MIIEKLQQEFARRGQPIAVLDAEIYLLRTAYVVRDEGLDLRDPADVDVLVMAVANQWEVLPSGAKK